MEKAKLQTNSLAEFFLNEYFCMSMVFSSFKTIISLKLSYYFNFFLRRVRALGSGSDFTRFYANLGISALDLRYTFNEVNYHFDLLYSIQN